MPRYAISDIHGCSRTFRHLVETVIGLTPDDELFLLGDYVDRGPDSKGVIDYIWELQQRGVRVRTLSGNHEAMMLEARRREDYLPLWYRNGGAETLASFGVESLSAIPAPYWYFLKTLEFYIELEDYLLVHAGFNFTAPRPFEDQHAMLWIRNFPLDHQVLGSRKIVHGHTPTPLLKIQNQVRKLPTPAINIDGGCVYRQAPELGHLTALNLDTLDLHATPYRG